MSKRPRDSYDTPESSSPPTRRPRLAVSSPVRPSTSTLFSTPSPYALRTPYSAPTDSPSNPFGLKRSLYALDLPKVSSFSRHTPIRMQVVIDGDTQRRTRGGVYRVVQIPNNYTFRHLHKLILFLFASDIDIDTPSSKGKARATSTSTSTSTSTWAGHYFQVIKDVSLYPESKHPGMMKPDGTTYAKLSSVRDRKLFRDLCDPSSSSFSTSAFNTSSAFNTTTTTEDASLPAMLEDEDADSKGEREECEWTWEAEDDFTIGHVWPHGPEIDRGIIYHHSPTLRLHITINTLPIPPRRGSSNVPFVFAAQGSVGPGIQVAHCVPDVYGNESYWDPCSSGSSSKANSKAKSKAKSSSLDTIPRTTIERWNAPGAFAAFLASEAERERALRLPRSFDFEGELADSRLDARSGLDASLSEGEGEWADLSAGALVIPSSDGLDICSSSSDGLDISSDAPSFYSTTSHSSLHSSSHSSLHSSLHSLELELETALETARGAPTPFPSNAYRKKRLERLGRRMERLVRRGLGVFGEGVKGEKESNEKGKVRSESESEKGKGEERSEREKGGGGGRVGGVGGREDEVGRKHENEKAEDENERARERRERERERRKERGYAGLASKPGPGPGRYVAGVGGERERSCVLGERRTDGRGGWGWLSGRSVREREEERERDVREEEEEEEEDPFGDEEPV